MITSMRDFANPKTKIRSIMQRKSCIGTLHIATITVFLLVLCGVRLAFRI